LGRESEEPTTNALGTLQDAERESVAIIDGDVIQSASLNLWKIGDAGLMPESDRDEAHGTFIAGLISAGSALNLALSADLEPTGCKFYDLDLFPRRELRSTYYSDIEELFDILEEKICPCCTEGLECHQCQQA